MKVDLSPLKQRNYQGTLPFHGEWLPSKEVFERERLVFHRPLQVKGQIWKEKNELQAEITLSGDAYLRCDRCNEWFDYRPRTTFTAHFHREGSDWEKDEEAEPADYHGPWYEKEARVDLEPGLIEQILFHLPSKRLCDEYCRGLCPICGENRNMTDCHCEQEDVDPRLAELRRWFEKKE